MADIDATYNDTYSSNMRMALNQQESRLAAASREEEGSGELHQIDGIMDNGKVKSRQARGADVVYDKPQFDRVWVEAPDQKYDADFEDTLDKVRRTTGTLTSKYVMKHSGTIRRAWDGIWLGGWDGKGGFYGNILTGKRGQVSVPFAGGNVIPVSTGATGPTGMNVAKVLAANELLLGGYVDSDQEWFMALTAKQITNLFNQVTVTSGDFQETWKPRFSADRKTIMGLAGFTFVQIELGNPLIPNYDLTVDGSGYRKTPVWTKDGMVMVPWAGEKLKSSIDMLPTKFRGHQILTTTMMNATATDNARRAIILNA